MRYRAEIDGLRALAVIPVVLYHAGFNWIPGGFIGVDVFFVISGFLISSILISELDRKEFSLVNFYERRARRILPALFVMIIVTAPFAYAYLLPDDMKSFWKSVLAVCFFVSNYLFSYESGYFAPDVELKPLLHTWSLAVEEQFYVIFPLILFATWKLGKASALLVVAAIVAISFNYADYGSTENPTLTFYSIATRAWELGIGSLAAFYFKFSLNYHKNKIISNVMSVFGLALIITGYALINKNTPFPGRYALFPTVGAALIIIFSSKSTIVGRLLSIRPVVFLGVISYSAYLWHQPMMSLARHKYVVEPPLYVMASICVMTVVIAWFSWKYIETPFRSKAGMSRSDIFRLSAAASLALILISAVGINTTILNRFDGSQKYGDLVNRLRGNFGLSKDCEKSFFHSKQCMTGDNPEILLWGDSYAMQVADIITASNPDVRMIQATISQCAPVIGASDANIIFGARNCIEANDKTLDLLRNTPSIKYVILASPFERMLNGSAVYLRGGEVVRNGSDVYSAMFKETLSKIKGMGKIPVIIAPPAKNASNDIGYCLLKSSLVDAREDSCNFMLRDIPQIQSKVYHFLGDLSKGVNVIWLTNMTCKEGVCFAEKDGNLLYRDKGHLSYEGSKYIGKTYNFYSMVTGG